MPTQEFLEALLCICNKVLLSQLCLLNCIFIFFTTKRALLNFPVPEEQEQKDSRCPDLTGQRSWLYSVLTLSPLSNGPRKGEEEVNGRAP